MFYIGSNDATLASVNFGSRSLTIGYDVDQTEDSDHMSNIRAIVFTKISDDGTVKHQYGIFFDDSTQGINSKNIFSAARNDIEFAGVASAMKLDPVECGTLCDEISQMIGDALSDGVEFREELSDELLALGHIIGEVTDPVTIDMHD